MAIIFTILAQTELKTKDNSLVMNRHSMLAASLFILLLIIPGYNGLFAQSKAKCTGTVLALNSAPVKRAEKRSAVKKPCDNTEKRINQRPQQTAVTSLDYYNNVTIDQLGETFINSYPGLTEPVEKPCSSKIKSENKKLTACRSQEKKDCDPKEKDTTPRRLRPSAAVKLASYVVEQ